MKRDDLTGETSSGNIRHIVHVISSTPSTYCTYELLPDVIEPCICSVSKILHTQKNHTLDTVFSTIIWNIQYNALGQNCENHIRNVNRPVKCVEPRMCSESKMTHNQQNAMLVIVRRLIINRFPSTFQSENIIWDMSVCDFSTILKTMHGG